MLSYLYNYIFGYVYTKCDYCNKKLYIKYNSNINNTLISCSNSCTYKLYQTTNTI